MIFQLVLLRGGVWGRGRGPSLRKPVWEPGWGGGGVPGLGAEALCSVSRWLSERARPVVLGCDEATRPWAPLPPPQEGGS